MILYCSLCGGVLQEDTSDACRCLYCGHSMSARAAENDNCALWETLGEEQRYRIYGLRRCLYDAVTAHYISRQDVMGACEALLTLLPDDPAARFYRTVAETDGDRVGEAIRAVDVERLSDHVDLMVEFLINCMDFRDDSLLLALSDLLERAYKAQDPARFQRYASMMQERYERERYVPPPLPRDVYISSAKQDLSVVVELVEALEEQGLSCFVPVRNLRYDPGSEEEWTRQRQAAIDNASVFLFVSSPHSRKPDCEAQTIELSYVMEQDIAGAPLEYRHSYADIPHIYKKPRIAYAIGESRAASETEATAEATVDAFFAGYERMHTAEEVLAYVTDLHRKGTVFW